MMTLAMPTATQTPPQASNKRTKRTYTISHACGPLVVDVWDALEATDAPPILLIHGWGGTGSYWRSTAFALSATHQVIVPDLPGTGRSQPVSQPQNMFDQVATLASLLDDLNLDRVQVIGHSMGGAMSILLAEQRPQQVTRIVLTSLSFFLSASDVTIYRAVMQLFKVSMRARPQWLVDVPFMQNMLAKRFFHHVPQDRPLLRQGLKDYLELDTGTAIACAQNAPDPSISAAGQGLTMPVLLVACRQDQVMPPQNVATTVDMIPDCRLYWIDDCGHMPMLEKADEYLSVVRDFIE